ncbi:MAG TPA: secretin N-terminal domain-containing protein [Dongiaceae bacterium]|nr:secretin N-terminal domain-containing protein [Dongiaceae bacterium]
MKRILTFLVLLTGFGLQAETNLPVVPPVRSTTGTNGPAVFHSRPLLPPVTPATSNAPAVSPTPVIPPPITPEPAPANPANPANPAAPAAPANAAANAAPDNTAADAPATKTAGGEEIIPAGGIHFQATPLEQVLDVYSDMVKRTVLRPAQLPAANITFNNVTDLTKTEALQALDSVLALNGIGVVPMGDKFVKVVPQAEINSQGGAISTNSAAQLPELGAYTTHVVQLLYTKPSSLTAVLTPFAKVPNAITPLDDNGILIIRDYAENVKRMLELIAKIDVNVPSTFESEVIPIKYALADDIANALNTVGGGASSIGSGSTGSTGRTGAGGASRTSGYGANRLGSTGNTANNGLNSQGRTAQPTQAQTFAQRLQGIISKAATGGAGEFQILGPNKIIADERTNSLLVFASHDDMVTIKKIISQLDVVLAQVLIEAVILDVTLADNFNFGVSAGQQPKSFTPSVTGGGVVNNGNGSVNSGLSFLQSFISSNGTNTTSGFPSTDGLTYFGKLGPTWDVAVSALAGNNNVKVLARPSIQTSHAVPANIFVGETRPYITGTYYDGYNSGSRSQYQQSQIGISLDVTPLINPDGLVVMDIQQQVQQVGGSVTIDGNDVPITQDQNASSKVAVRNGETIVMGGFIQNQKSETKSGVPYLQDIPLLGGLFRSTKNTSSRRELLVLIRPTVLPTPEAAALQTSVERDRLPIVKQTEAEFQADNAKLLKKVNKEVKADKVDFSQP